jgi:energy-coupling factor transport system ATP-binding protein
VEYADAVYHVTARGNELRYEKFPVPLAEVTGRIEILDGNLRLSGLSGKALVERVRLSMEETHLGYDEFRDRRTRSLSGGEKRRLALAGVLAMGGEALLLDEPTSALDPGTKRSILELILAKARGGTTVVMSTHSMEEAALADMVAVFSEGRIVALGDPETIFYDRYDPSWGIGRPFAVEAAALLEKAGVALNARPLTLDVLAGELA